MHFLNYFQSKTLKHDLLNKFNYKNINDLPKLEKVILNFGCKTNDMKQLSTAILALELITNQKGILTKSKKSNILFKIRKGNPVGCKVTLQKKSMFKFLEKILLEIFPKIKNFSGLTFSKRIKKNSFSFSRSCHFFIFHLIICIYIYYQIKTNKTNKQKFEFFFQLFEGYTYLYLYRSVSIFCFLVFVVVVVVTVTIHTNE